MQNILDPFMNPLGIYPKNRIKYVSKMYAYHFYYTFIININVK